MNDKDPSPALKLETFKLFLCAHSFIFGKKIYHVEYAYLSFLSLILTSIIVRFLDKSLHVEY